MSTTVAGLGPARYTWGGDEFLFVEIAEAMSLAANFKVMSLARALTDAALEGVVDICPANASLLIRFNPDLLGHEVLQGRVRELEARLDGAEQARLETRIIEIPVWYQDP